MSSFTDESIGERFLALSNKQPNKSWCIYYDGAENIKNVSFGEIKERSLHFAMAFGNGPEKKIAICLYPSPDLHAAFLGAILAGHIPAMMPPFSNKTEPEKLYKTISHFLHSMKPEIVVIDDESRQRLADADIHFPSEISLVSPLQIIESPFEIKPQRGGLDCAFIQHSSGTTGLQKGVALSHRSVIRHFESYSQAISLNKDTDIFVSWLPLYHDMGLISCFLMPLMGGNTIIEIPTLAWANKPRLLFDAITTYKPTLCWLPNFAFNYLAQGLKRLMDTTSWDISSIRLWTNCSEPISYQSQINFFQTFEKIGCVRSSMGASYAMAENVFAVTQVSNAVDNHIKVSIDGLSRREIQLPIDGNDERVLVSCGRPVNGVSLKILEPESEIESILPIGEIALKSEFMFTEYWNNSELTSKAFTAAGYFRTGDSGLIYNDMVFVTGRLKDIIIIQGKNIHPGDVEEVLSGLHGLIPGRIVAIGLAEKTTGTESLAILAETELIDEGEKKILVGKMRIKIFSELNISASLIRLLPPRWLIKSTSGKMARNENREKLMQLLDKQNV